ncbi:hypothetical protein [Kitasatospora sp. NPDC085464]|uniref:hypothetical protein n=1 Tax=Kitasatospora sp. NPDC085464 TaxID=3364063 RepID=UPI0037CA1993
MTVRDQLDHHRHVDHLGPRAEVVDDSVPRETEWLTKNDGIVLPGQTNDAARWVTREQIRSAAEGRDPAALWYYSGTCRGRSVEEATKATAGKYGGETMMMLIEGLGMPTPFYSDYSDRAEAFWRDASAGFSEAARGEVRVVFGDTVRRTGNWHRVECPTLVANPRVTTLLWARPGTLFRPLPATWRTEPRDRLPPGVVLR